MNETVKISVRNLVEFILREGDIDLRRTAGADKEQSLGQGSTERSKDRWDRITMQKYL